MEKPLPSTYQLDEWDSFWENRSLRTPEEFTSYIEWAKSTSKFREILRHLNINLGRSLSGASTIELGCGEANYSLILAGYGAKTLAVDYSKAALSRAQRNFNQSGLDGDFLQGDFQHLPESHLGKFDISLSFGTVEHYSGNERLKMIKLHHDLLRPGGIAIISVPNKYCIPYSIWLHLQRLRSSTMPDEIPFSQAELRNLVQRSGGELIEIVCESAVDSTREFMWRLLLGPVFKKIGLKNLDLASGSRWRYRDPATILDGLLGYALISVSRRL